MEILLSGIMIQLSIITILLSNILNKFKNKIKMDKIVKNVIDKFQERSDVGIEKYGVTLEREDLTTLQWINHAQEEAMDFCLYLERLKVQENRLKQLLTVTRETAFSINYLLNKFNSDEWDEFYKKQTNESIY